MRKTQKTESAKDQLTAAYALAQQLHDLSAQLVEATEHAARALGVDVQGGQPDD